MQRYLAARSSRPDAEDAAQELWLDVWKYRHSYDPARPFAPWLWTITARRRRTRTRDVPSPTAPTGRDSAPPDAAVHARHLLLRVLDVLPPSDRSVVLLSARGLSTREIADALDSTAGAVRTRLSRARTTLRSQRDSLSVP